MEIIDKRSIVFCILVFVSLFLIPYSFRLFVLLVLFLTFVFIIQSGIWIYIARKRIENNRDVPNELFDLDKAIKKLFKKDDNRIMCPDCGDYNWLEGPSGGMATNLKCDTCGSYVNYGGPQFGLIGRIHHVEHNPEESNFQKFKRPVLNWCQIELNDITKYNLEELYKWCGNNLKGKWSIKDHTVYFKKEDDLVAFKMKWA